MTSSRPSRHYRFMQLDVFTDRPFGGNQLAVFPEAEGLSTEEMAVIACEMNYSETTFVLPATDASALCRVRIFTPGTELPFAGHPTVGTAIALAHEQRITAGENGSTSATLQLGIGPIAVEVLTAAGSVPFAWMHQPVATFSPWHGDRGRLAAALGLAPTDLEPDGLPAEVGSAGVPSIYLPLSSRDALKRSRPGDPDLGRICAEAGGQGVYCFAVEADEAGTNAYARYFAPGVGIAEDPATGSAAGPLGTYLVTHTALRMAPDGVARVRVEQGVEMGRPSVIEVHIEGTTTRIRDVRVGGHAVLVARGELYVDGQ
jgi:trans-2,3-dihydro-3-hydroxyanthranilate isomerase